MEKNELQERLFRFSVSIIKSVRKLPKGVEFMIISRQLIKSATSAGANYDEAQGAVSKADFTNKVGITLKEMRESNYWIRIILAVMDKPGEWHSLNTESQELMNILGSIFSKTSTPR